MNRTANIEREDEGYVAALLEMTCGARRLGRGLARPCVDFLLRIATVGGLMFAVTVGLMLP